MTKEKEYTRYINDPIMDPFFISMDDSCITVNAKVMPDARYTTSTKEYTKIIGHYSNIKSALKSIANQKINSKSYDSLREYMNEYQTLVENFNKTINI